MTVLPFHSACFYSTNNGSTVGLRSSEADERDRPLPAGVTNLYRFDEALVNNAGLIAAWQSNAARFGMAGSTVLLDGHAASFDPPGLVFRALENAQALWAKLTTTSDALTREEQAQLGAISFSARGLLD